MLAKYLYKLRDEVQNDPLSRGYAEMTNQQVANDLNTEYRERNLSSLDGDKMFQQTDPTEFGGLTDAKKQMWISFTTKSIDPWATNNEEFVKYIFGDTSTTVSSLANARVETITRAKELGYDDVTEQTIINLNQ